MGKKLRKEAQKLGFLNYPKTVLYGGTSDLTIGFAWREITSIPIWTRFIEGYLKNLDPATKLDISKPGRNKFIFILAPKLHLYIEIDAKTVGFLDIKKNHVQQINIYSRDNKYVNEIVYVINNCYKSGILNEIIWEKVGKKFNINQEREIQMWKDILEQLV